MKEINLEKIIDSIANFNKDEDGNTIYYLWEVKKAMKQACSKVLDLAAENVVGKVDLIYRENLEYPSCEEVAVIDKDSILQIKDWIK